jgi:hypothetical protein
MGKKMSTIVTAEVPTSGKLVLIRTDFPDDDEHIWCGEEWGWLPFLVGRDRQCEFESIEAASKGIEKYCGWPLGRRP